MVENDPIWRILSGISIVIGAILALRPDWFIYVASYGRKREAKGIQMLMTRIVAAAVALILLQGLIWPQMSK
jgi:hypothetical protein